MQTILFNAHPKKIAFFKAMRRFARRRVRPGMTMLDVACNDFRMAFLFPGVDYIGADLDHDRLIKGRQRWPDAAHHGVCCDVRKLPFAANSFDVVICTHTLIHVPEARGKTRAVRELLRVLNPGGDLVFNISDWEDWVDEMLLEISPGFASIRRVTHRRRLMTWWENRLVNGPPGRSRTMRAIFGMAAPLIHLADRFGRPTMTLVICEDLRAARH